MRPNSSASAPGVLTATLVGAITYLVILVSNIFLINNTTSFLEESVMEHPTTWPDAESVDAITETDSNAITYKKFDNLWFKSPETSQQ